MLLLIDAGNTLIKWAFAATGTTPVRNRNTWLDSGSMPYHDIETLPKKWNDFLRDAPLQRVLISNVSGKTTQIHLLKALEELPIQLSLVEWFKSVPVRAGISNNYCDVTQLGSDRFASLIGARALYPNENLVVVTCGTATTIDTLMMDGKFVGGMILPGLNLMTASLSGNTAQLPETGPSFDNIPAHATDTINAIRNGCMSAQVGAIEHAVNIHAKNLKDVRCLLSGGAAKIIAAYLSIPAQIVDNLVLIGLHAADAEINKSDR